jgi:hypothetical protein
VATATVAGGLHARPLYIAAGHAIYRVRLSTRGLGF